MKLIRVLFVLSFLSLLITGCSSAEDTSSNNEEEALMIYTSVYPIQYAVE